MLAAGGRSPAPSSMSSPAADSGYLCPNRDRETPRRCPRLLRPTMRSPKSARVCSTKPFTGDFDEMVKRRLIRAGVVFNRTQYFIDKGVQRGISYESITLFEEQLNKRLKTGPAQGPCRHRAAVARPAVPRPSEGKVDFVAAALTITPERRKVADFSTPTRTGVSEIVVTRAGRRAARDADDLSGREVFVRRSSSYYESLAAAERIARQPRQAAGDHQGGARGARRRRHARDGQRGAGGHHDRRRLRRRVLAPGVPEHAARTRTPRCGRGGEIAIGVRKNNPKLLQAANAWIKEYGPRTAFGNTMERRYLQNADYVKNAAAEAERKKLRALVKLFETYGSQIRRGLPADGGAGLPGIAARPVGEEPRRRDRRDAGDAGDGQGAGRRRHHPGRAEHPRRREVLPLHDGPVLQGRADGRAQQGADDAGVVQRRPGRIRQLRAETAQRGLDPNVWFGNVERVSRSGSAARPSSTSATSTSTTSPTGSCWIASRRATVRSRR